MSMLQDEMRFAAASREAAGPYFPVGAAARLQKRTMGNPVDPVLNLSHSLWGLSQLAALQVRAPTESPGSLPQPLAAERFEPDHHNRTLGLVACMHITRRLSVVTGPPGWATSKSRFRHPACYSGCVRSLL